jgi:hypothetical protein
MIATPFCIITQQVLLIYYSWALKMTLIICPETSVRNYHYSLRNNSEEHSYHPLHGGILESRTKPTLHII